MIVRLFVPQSREPNEGPVFSASDHNFPVLPQVGHALRFTDERKDKDFSVSRVGFVQDADAFIAAVWLEGPDTQPPKSGEKPVPQARNEYRDLNHDVPPESMTGY
ncbi:hypothetical protein KRR38_08680 [Novosphingobium sp. G106]|uniref:hypothetical protein n=1 Tax=Novosphingobium sp. G106 TaxID=2849500 RepID=UPI001C2D5033|nr:hypothetical protein [Novosphingobium sp. G106]MBV1687747.1 hypothetical protein [Novosphingobium sp. G106]